MKKSILTILFLLCAMCTMHAQTEKKKKQKEVQDTTRYQQDKNAVRNGNKGDTINKPQLYPADTTKKNFPPHQKAVINQQK